MDRLVECVPNFSEGRRSDVIDAITTAAVGAVGAWLLDRTSDADHGRMVLTLAGRPEATAAAAASAARAAIEHIDMRSHTGAHPRIGAVDVVPFVPIGSTAMSECISLARSFGAALAAEHDLPVFLYGEAATRADRRTLADIRRPRFEGLAASMARPGGEPDYGPAVPHPTAGATAVGARPYLIAFNIQLESDDVSAARRIAVDVRESSGGLPRVQALGLYMEHLGCAQVSMNLLDHRVTPLWRAWEEVRRLAALEGIDLRDSELIGLIPAAALDEVAGHIGTAWTRSDAGRWTEAASWLKLRDYDPDVVLESRLARLAAGVPPTG